MPTLTPWLSKLPLIAILRGLRPDEAVAIGEALVGAGFGLIEVPLNSPSPLRSIERLATRFEGEALIGAGTVTTPQNAADVIAAGGRLIVMPHADAEVIAVANGRGAACLPGVATPGEAFAALKAGADGLKLFPAEMLPPTVVRAWRAVLPGEVGLFPVGGIAPATMAAYHAAGASGFGLGSALYRPGDSPDDVALRATEFVAAWRSLDRPQPAAGVSA